MREIEFVKGERLSVTLMREHVESGHSGEFESYCYRCEYFYERQRSARLELEIYGRHVLRLGPVRIMLWKNRGEYATYLRELLATDPGQEDRDKQPGRWPDSE